MQSEAQPLEEGVPDWSIYLVSHFFAVAINSLINARFEGIRGSMYGDDVYVSFSAANMMLVERKLQLAISTIIEWASGFCFSASKITATLLFFLFRLHGIHPDMDLFLYDRSISCVEGASSSVILFYFYIYLLILAIVCLGYPISVTSRPSA